MTRRYLWMGLFALALLFTAGSGLPAHADGSRCESICQQRFQTCKAYCSHVLFRQCQQFCFRRPASHRRVCFSICAGLERACERECDRRIDRCVVACEQEEPESPIDD